MIGPACITLVAVVAAVAVWLGLHDGPTPDMRPVSASACVDLLERVHGPVPCPPTYGVGTPGLERHVTD